MLKQIKVILWENKKRRYFFLLFFLITIWYLVVSVMAPLKWFEQLIEIKSKSVNISKLYITNDSGLIKIQKDITFMQSRIKAVKSDSVALSINLEDSAINLDIKGVTVHKSKILNISVNNILYKQPGYTYLMYTATPDTVVRSWSTIVKEPVIHKKAPKDTIEALKNYTLPDTTDNKPVHFVLRLQNGIDIEIGQADKRALFVIRRRLAGLSREILQMLSFKVPEYHPQVILKLNRKEAKTIYRALPEHALVTIKYPRY